MVIAEFYATSQVKCCQRAAVDAGSKPNGDVTASSIRAYELAVKAAARHMLAAYRVR